MYELNITDKDINIDIEDTDKYIKYIEKLTNINWRIIPDFEDYIISEYGDIISLKSKRILKNFLHDNGYYTTDLYKNNTHKTFKTHRLVYKAFIDKDIEDFDVHHKDENRSNNHYSNLEKINHSIHLKYHRDLKIKKHLKKDKKIYNEKVKYNLSNSKLAKKYNIPKYTIKRMIKRYKIYLYLDKDLDKYISLSTKNKNKLYSDIILIENKRKYLEKCEKIYNLHYHNNKSTKEIAKKYNVPEYIIYKRIKDYEIYLYLDKDFNKYISLSKKDKDKLYTKLYNNKLLKDQKKYLKECKELYNYKIKYNLSNKQLSEKYNIPEFIISEKIKKYRIYLYLNEDINKYINLSEKDKDDIYTNILVNDQRKYLEKCKELYDLKYKDHLFTKEIIKKYNVSECTINKMIKRYKIYLYLDKDFNKYISLSKKDKNKLYTKMLVEKRNNTILTYGKQIEDLKLSGLSTKDIANKLNISIKKIIYYYKRYKDLIKRRSM